MIVFWKKVGQRYTANWNNINLVLVENKTTRRWHLLANDRSVTGTWPTAKVAMQRIDDRQQAIVMQKAREFAERMRHLSDVTTLTPAAERGEAVHKQAQSFLESCTNTFLDQVPATL